MLEDESGGHQAIGVVDKILKQVANVIGASNFSFIFDKVQPSFATETHTSRHRDMLTKLFALNKKTTWLDVGFLSTRQNLSLLKIL